MVEIIGIVATVFILVSMCFKTLTFRGSLCMRILNVVGSAIFVVYGCLLPAISTAVLNAGLIIVNVYHIIKLVIEHNKTKTQ